MVIKMEVYLSALLKYFNILSAKICNFNVVNFKIINPSAKKNDCLFHCFIFTINLLISVQRQTILHCVFVAIYYLNGDIILQIIKNAF